MKIVSKGKDLQDVIHDQEAQENKKEEMIIMMTGTENEDHQEKEEIRKIAEDKIEEIDDCIGISIN